MDANEAIASEQIRQLIARYNHAGDRGRLDALLDCFTDDAVMELPALAPLHGRAAIRAHLEGVVADFAAATRSATLRHHVASLWIEVEGKDAARASSYFSVFTEIGLDHWGGYRDEFRREGEHWRIARRKVWLDGAAPGSRMVKDVGASREGV